jgi:predicted nucleic acid-binding protein
VKVVVADTGPVLHLHQAGALDLLPALGEVQITPTVIAELRRHAPGLWRDEFPSWLRRVTPSDDAKAQAANWLAAGLLDGGEAESLAYAKEAAAELFLTDDAAARLMAESIGVPARGSLGIVLYCAAIGQLSREEAENHLHRLIARTTLWVSVKVRQTAAEALATIFK